MNDVMDGETVLNLPFGSLELAARAFARIEPELASVPDDKLATINVDIARVVVGFFPLLPRLKSLRSRIVEELPRFPIACLDNLETYALGAFYAHLLTISTPPENAKKPIIGEATTLRGSLLVAAEALADRNLLDPKRVAMVRRGRGHADLVNDLLTLAALFTNAWESLAGKTAVTWEEVERAQELGTLLVAILEAPAQMLGRSPADLADQRRRAFTLFARAYEECRRAVAYLRWHEGDANEIAPSLYAKRGKPSKAAPASAPAVPAQPPPPEPPTSGGGCSS